MDLLADYYLLDNVIAQERLRAAFLLLAMAGVALLFLRGGAAKAAGALLILTRIVAMPMRGTEWLLLGAIAAIGLIAVLLRRGEEAEEESGTPEVLEAPARDDASEPAPCPACRAVIPAGSARCPSCGWTYAAD